MNRANKTRTAERNGKIICSHLSLHLFLTISAEHYRHLLNGMNAVEKSREKSYFLENAV